MIFNKDQIYNAAKNIIENYGIEFLTIKDIASNLKSSTQPIYRNFKSISEIKENYFIEYSNDFLKAIKENSKNKFDELVFSKCKENPLGFRSFFFHSEKYPLLRKKIEDELLKKIKKTVKLSNIEILNILLSFCSFYCLDRNINIENLKQLFNKII